MGNIVGILSTVILVSTVATLIFAVFAYIASRKCQQTATTKKHSGDFVIPEQQRAPDLPPEFILRMHEVRSDTIGKSENASAPPEKKKAVKKIDPPPEPPPPGTPAFRSLTEKRRSPAPKENPEPGKTSTDS